jgi:hypothetical protein
MKLNYNVIFSSNNVTFQDIVMKKTIGEDELVNGLYYLDILNKAFIINNIEEND